MCPTPLSTTVWSERGIRIRGGRGRGYLWKGWLSDATVRGRYGQRKTLCIWEKRHFQESSGVMAPEKEGFGSSMVTVERGSCDGKDDELPYKATQNGRTAVKSALVRSQQTEKWHSGRQKKGRAVRRKFQDNNIGFEKIMVLGGVCN